jgi:O-antigen ligase
MGGGMSPIIDRPRELSRAALAFVIAVLPAVFWVAVPENVEYPKFVFLTLGAALLAGLAISDAMRPQAASSQMGRRRIDWLAIGIAALAGSSVVSAIFGLHPRASFLGTPFSSAGAFAYLDCAILFFAVRRLRPTVAEMRLLIVAGLPAATAIIGYALVQRLGLDPLAWEQDHLSRAIGTLGHPNHLAGYLALVLPAFAVVGLEAIRRRDGLLFGATALVGAAGVWMLVETVCRTGWLAAAAAAIVLGLLLALGRLPWRTCLAIGVVLLVTIVGTATWVLVRHGSASGQEAVGSNFVLRTGTWNSRVAMWRDCARVFARYPITGCGTDNLQLAFVADRSIEYVRLEPQSAPHRAHNLVVHLAATQGIVGLAAGLVLLVGIGLTLGGVLRQMARRSSAGDVGVSRYWSAAALAGLAAFAVNGMSNYTPLAIGVPTVLFVALLSVRARESNTADSAAVGVGYRWGVGVALAAIPLVFALNLAGTLHIGGWAVLLVASVAIAWFGRRLLGRSAVADLPSPPPRGRGAGGEGEQNPNNGILSPQGTFPLTPALSPEAGEREKSAVADRPAWSVGRRGVVFASWIGLAVFLGNFVLAPLESQRLRRQAATFATADPARSVAILEEAIRWAPTDDGLWAALAELENDRAAKRSAQQDRRLHSAAAEAAATEAVRLSPLDGTRRYVLVVAQRVRAILGVGAWEPALANMETILARDANDYCYRIDSVELAQTANDPVRIRRWAEEGRARFPQCGQFAGALGQLELAAGNNEAARKLLESGCAGQWSAHEHCRLSCAVNLLVACKRLGDDARLCELAPAIVARWPWCEEARALHAEALQRRGTLSSSSRLPSR